MYELAEWKWVETASLDVSDDTWFKVSADQVVSLLHCSQTPSHHKLGLVY